MTSIPCVSREHARTFIDDEFARPQSNKVLHSHPSPLLWQANDGKAAERFEARANFAQAHVLADNFYLSTPFCIPTVPAHCGFCLFPTTEYQGNGGMQTYLSYLEKEANLYAPYVKHDRLASVYVGGGTPNLLRADDYGRLMDITRNLYGEIPEHIECTIEGIPQLFTREKVTAIKEAGFNRVSMGVQQMSDRLIQYSGRRQTHRQVLDALDAFNETKLAVNVDLIFGWPDQSMDDMLNDLRELTDLGVRHLTLYQLNVAGKSNFSKVQRAQLPSLDVTVAMYLEAQRFLLSRGYRQATVYDWERIEAHPGRFETEGAEQYAYEALQRDFLKIDGKEIGEFRNIVGLGYAAITGVSTEPVDGAVNFMQINVRSLEAYFAKVDAGQLPIEKQFCHNRDDVKLVWLFQSMQAMSINIANYSAIFSANLLEEFGPIFDELDARGWIRMDGDMIRFIGVGQFHIPLIQALFSYARMEQLRAHLKKINTDKKTMLLTAI